MGHRKGFWVLHKVPTWEDSGPSKEPEGGSSSPVQAWNAVLPQGYHPHPLLQAPHYSQRPGTHERPGEGAKQGHDALGREGCKSDLMSWVWVRGKENSHT